MEYTKKIFAMIGGIALLVGIPYLTGSWYWLWASWIPAIFAYQELES
jgi:hypothetical protein